MKFNKQTNEKGRLIELIKKSHQNKNIELEALIHHEGCHKLIKYDDFLSCLSRIKNQKEFKSLTPKEVLNITFRPDSKYRCLRVSIIGRETVRSFCSHGRIKDLGSNVRYYHKEIQKDSNGKIERVDLSDYKVRFNLKEERDLGEDHELVKEIQSQWFEVPKFFRYKKIFTFETLNGLFRNDFAIVKESRNEIKEMYISEVRKYNLEDLVLKPDSFKGKFSAWWHTVKNKPKELVKVCDQPVYYQSFQKSGTLDGRPSYEIEVEYLGNQKGQIMLSEEEVLSKFVQLVGIHLQAIQKSYFVMGESEKDQVIRTYQQLTGLKGSNLFKAPLPITVEVGHLQRLTNRQYLDNNNLNLRKNYLVTEKADGERNLLYVDPVGSMYFINRQNLIRKLGVKMPDLASTLIDGEYLSDQNLFMVFDAYFFQGDGVWKQVFDPRYEAVKKFVEYVKKNMDVSNKTNGNDIKYPLNVDRKVFYRGDITMRKDKVSLDESHYDTLIFDACKKILKQVSVSQGGLLDVGHQFSYNVDGLIFVPLNLHVGQDYIGHNVTEYSMTQSWNRTFKWKPPKMNSIDMVTEVYHPSTSVDFNEQYYNGIPYRQVILKVNYQPDYHNRYNSQRVLNEGISNTPGLKAFTPNYPFVGHIDYNGHLVDESYIAWVPVDLAGNMIALDKSAIQDGEVVEYAYDMNEDDIQFRWKPLRVRANKKANGYHTAINVWRSIHNPISTEMIIGDVDIPQSETYYQSNTKRSEYYLKEMKSFHNFVKSRLLDHISQDKKRPYILDLCCGKLGDLYKWKNQKANFVLAVDSCPDGLDNYNDGGAVRALMAQEHNSNFKRLNSNLMVVLADCTKPLNTGEAGLNALNEYYLKVLYGGVDLGDYSKLGRLSGHALQKFDIVTCHFAIHYFFNNYERLTGFLDNVHQNLRTNGYFIGTCLDGQSLYEKLGKSKTGVISKFQDPDEQQLIWRIIKKYNNTGSQMPSDENSLGMEIDVDLENINNTSHEYLVNFDFLVSLLNQYGLELVDSKLFNEIPNSMLEEFYDNVKSEGHILKSKHMALEYSLLHRWFIFQKKSLAVEGPSLTAQEEAEILNAGVTDLDDNNNNSDNNSDHDDKSVELEVPDLEEVEGFDSQKVKMSGKDNISKYRVEYDYDDESEDDEIDS
uniref:mRNA (guanine-N(7))-methyltransferase n=1 Tax=viral metagenome TaxID=1070528 RepID=A0A6C0E5R2_9ZZZZ